MSFLGKIFVILLLIMSIVFMTIAAMVYGMHRNWRTIAKTNQTKLSETQQAFDALQDEYNRVSSELQRQIASSVQQVRKLETEREQLTSRNDRLEDEVDQLNEANRVAAAAVDSTQRDNERLATEIAGLRTEIRENQVAADDAIKKTLEVTEMVASLEGELKVASERSAQLVAEASRMKFILNENDINPDLPTDAVKPRVDGFVSAIRRRGGSLLIEVTIGADDGLQVGHTVEVFRKTKYLGRVEILKTSPDRAVGRVDNKFQEGRIQEGDRVATKLRVS